MPRTALPGQDPDTGEFRPIDGAGNNTAHPARGKAGTALLRKAPVSYADGVSTPPAGRPNPRLISNVLMDQGGRPATNARQMSAMVYAWGQFLDHDLGLSVAAVPAQEFDVPVPSGDPSFDPGGRGNKVITLHRSAFDPNTSSSGIPPVPRQQLNTITGWVDGSQVYGSDAATAAKLRTFSGGRLKTSTGNLLPVNDAATFPTGVLPMDNNAHRVLDAQLFAAGDVRANENVELTCLHALFVREHNRAAGEIQAANRLYDDETVYQLARARTVAMLQVITYSEWLPALLGPSALKPYRGYDASVDPGIANEFSTAALRVGHTLLADDVEFVNDDGSEAAAEIPLSEAFFNPVVVREHGLEPILKYIVTANSAEADVRFVDGVRNFLFGPPGSGGLDLAALDIQRGRDHGLADYNSMRVAYGLRQVNDFAQITSDADLQDKLHALYGTVEDIDPLVGMLAEDLVPGSATGPLARAVLVDQFARLRDGDRFWYRRVFSGADLRVLERTRLTDVIRRNTGLKNLQADAFFFRAEVNGIVFDDGPKTGKRKGNKAKAGVPLELVKSDGEVVGTAVTDVRGKYRFTTLEGLGPGRYVVRPAEDSEFLQTTAPAAVVVTKGDTFVTVNVGVADRG